MVWAAGKLLASKLQVLLQPEGTQTGMTYVTLAAPLLVLLFGLFMTNIRGYLDAKAQNDMPLAKAAAMDLDMALLLQRHGRRIIADQPHADWRKLKLRQALGRASRFLWKMEEALDYGTGNSRPATRQAATTGVIALNLAELSCKKKQALDQQLADLVHVVGPFQAQQAASESKNIVTRTNLGHMPSRLPAGFTCTLYNMMLRYHLVGYLHKLLRRVLAAAFVSASCKAMRESASENGKRGRLRVFSEAEDELGIGTLLGDYEEQGGNTDPKLLQVSVYVYYWDTRDGLEFSGWWFGDKVGGSQVWSRATDNSKAPPERGWKVPWDGEAIEGLLCVEVLNAGLAQPVSAPPAPVPPPKAAPMKAKVQEPDDVDKDLLKERIRLATDRVASAEAEAEQVVKAAKEMVSAEARNGGSWQQLAASAWQLQHLPAGGAPEQDADEVVIQEAESQLRAQMARAAATE
ncbi:Man1a1 [Symbiodinium natans]|uniref:Man1a1 protein n=1 Tax=Symbiodinium natans TaxID=878477 RepID=A0A812QQ23_9DINO|nr:Man1a1 [Symbiodinium natans]